MKIWISVLASATLLILSGCSSESKKEEPKATQPIKHETTDDKIKRSFFDKYIDKIKEFLDNAE